MTPEVCEAVIISGPRKGSIIAMNGNNEAQYSIEEEEALDVVLKAAHGVSQRAQALTAELQGLSKDLRDLNGRLNGSGEAD